MRRILSHVEPSSNTPRNLLHDVRRQLGGAVPGEIPWCKEVTAADVAGRMGPSTGYRSPPCSFNPVAASSSGPADGAKASAIAKIDAEAEALDQIALQLWKNPELGCAPAPLTLPPRVHTARRLTGICVSFCAQTTSRLRTGASRISWRRRRARRWSVASATSRPHSAPSTTPARTARKLLTRPSAAAARSQPAAGGPSASALTRAAVVRGAPQDDWDLLRVRRPPRHRPRLRPQPHRRGHRRGFPRRQVSPRVSG